MRNKRSFKSIFRTIQRYGEDVTIVSETSSLNKKSGLFENLSTKKVDKLAVFKKSSKYELKSRGAVIYADVKIYSTLFLKSDDEPNVAQDVVLHDGFKYKIISTEKRVECTPVVYICYGELLND